MNVYKVNTPERIINTQKCFVHGEEISFGKKIGVRDEVKGVINYYLVIGILSEEGNSIGITVVDDANENIRSVPFTTNCMGCKYPDSFVQKACTIVERHEIIERVPVIFDNIEASLKSFILSESEVKEVLKLQSNFFENGAFWVRVPKCDNFSKEGMKIPCFGETQKVLATERRMYRRCTILSIKGLNFTRDEKFNLVVA